VPNAEFNKESIQDFLKERLPNYMVPGFYVALDELPLTPNGKVDLKKLPNISEQDITKSEYAAPRSKEEKLLVSVWEDVLKRSPISIKENFYNLGGDSIKSIQIISRLKQQGYSLKINDILRVAVLEQLAKHMEVSNRIIDQSPVEGEIGLTPIQHYFFENNIFKAHHHFNQSVILKSAAELNSDFLSKSVTFLIHHHDALRMIFKKEGDNWKQYNTGIQKDDFIIDFHDLRSADDELLIMAKIGEQLQSGFNLEGGSLFKAAHFRLTSGDRVALIIHHLVVDGVSWRILLEDLSAIYTQLLSGAAIELPLKTDSFQLWSSLQQDYAHGEQIKLEKPYWESVSNQLIPAFPTDKKNPEFNAKIDSSISFTLDKNTTELLQTKAHRAYNTEINDVLLTGLGLSIKNVFGLDKTILKMEGHGREEIIADVDINRTVGWFTSFYPFVLDISNSSSNTLIKVKEDLRKIPNKGVGYGILKYLTKQYSDTLIPAIEFNYLGDFGSGVTNKNEDSIFEYASEYIGANNNDSNGNDVLLIVTGILVDEKLSITINFNKEIYHKKTIQYLVDSYKENLVALIEKLSAIRENYLTPSDLTFKGLSVLTLLELNKDNEIEDVYKLSPLQQGIYFHWLSNGISSLYFEQISYRIKASDLDITTVKEAYDKLVARHAVLRTGFKYDQTNELPIQIVRKMVSGNFLHKKLPSYAIDLNEYVETIKLEDRNMGFDLESNSQMRLQILDLGNDNYEFIWSHHHILADGWCMSILIKDFYQILNSISQKAVLNLPKTFPYSNYIKWLDGVNTNDSMAYWKTYLQGYSQIAEIPFSTTIQEDQKYTEAKETVTIGENLYKKINSLCASIGITQNTFIQVAWGFLLSRYNNTQDVVFGSVVSGRPGELEGIEDMIGLFINTIPVRIKYADGDTPYDLLKRVQEDAISGSTYHYSNLAEINAQSELGMKLFSHIMIFENYPIQDILENGIKNSQTNNSQEIKIESVTTFEQTNYDFDISILPSSLSLAIDFKYNTKKYESKFMKNLVKHMYNLIEQFTDNINKPLDTFNYLSAEEKEQLLFEFNDTAVYYPKDKSIIDLFENQVSKTPDNIAVVFEGASLTYK
ncbi:condensation domain-containing protein, partial [Flavobacterium sp. Leaf82]|uniref:condensation domain-containing protein n=1 Tax=Flavobacterium sp. Leaf82 TaxID=1736238 RepID=UPI000AC96E75